MHVLVITKKQRIFFQNIYRKNKIIKMLNLKRNFLKVKTLCYSFK